MARRMDDDGHVDLGPCCICEKHDRSVRNLIELEQKAPEPGWGWGCVVCHQECDGALAVICDECLEAWKGQPLPLKFAIAGPATHKRRVPIGELVGVQRHDLRYHPEALAWRN